MSTSNNKNGIASSDMYITSGTAGKLCIAIDDIRLYDYDGRKTTVFGNGDGCGSLSIDIDGDRINRALKGPDGVVQIFDVNTGKAAAAYKSEIKDPSGIICGTKSASVIYSPTVVKHFDTRIASGKKGPDPIKCQGIILDFKQWINKTDDTKTEYVALVQCPESGRVSILWSKNLIDLAGRPPADDNKAVRRSWFSPKPASERWIDVTRWFPASSDMQLSIHATRKYAAVFSAQKIMVFHLDENVEGGATKYNCSFDLRVSSADPAKVEQLPVDLVHINTVSIVTSAVRDRICVHAAVDVRSCRTKMIVRGVHIMWWLHESTLVEKNLTGEKFAVLDVPLNTTECIGSEMRVDFVMPCTDSDVNFFAVFADGKGYHPVKVSTQGDGERVDMNELADMLKDLKM